MREWPMPETLRTSVIAGVLLAAFCGVARADVENLEQFLRDCEAAARVSAPLRGDGQLEVTTPNGTPPNGSSHSAVLIVRPTADIYIELHNPVVKALLLSEGSAYRFTAGAAAAEAFAADAPLAASDFTREDLQPFRVAQYQNWRISDESANEVTVMLFPTAPQYSLVVITFDRDKHVPVKTLYYRDTVNNLVKMRRDTNYTLIGQKWMPETISMETFKLHTHSTLSVHWTQSPQVSPELFDPTALPRVSAAATAAAP